MKINSIQKNNTKPQQAPHFKAGADIALRFLATNQGVGANLTDLGFMVIPRVASDAQRGPAACVETARREASGTANHSLIGAYGLASGIALASIMRINKNYGTNANSMFTAPETLRILADKKSEQVQNHKLQSDYLKAVFKNVKAFNPTSTKADKEGYVRLSEDTIDYVVKIIDKTLYDKDMNFKKWSNKELPESFNVVKNKIISDTGAESEYILEASNRHNSSKTSLKTLLEDVYKVSESFNQNEVRKAFEEQILKGKTIKDNTYIKKLGNFFKTRSGAGFVIATGIGMSIQPLNIYLTKLKTGSDGFVGVEGRTKDDSTEFKLLKGVASAGFLGMTMATLGTGFKGFMDKMSFKGFWPTINQLKGIYGLTIISRLLAARDKDELRESLTKDTLGFLSWLVLGDIVNKMTAEKLDKTVMNRTADISKKGFFNRIFHSKLKTRDEILIETLSANNKEIFKKQGGLNVAKTFDEMLVDLEKLPEHIRKSTKKRLSTLNKAQLAGYIFSGLVLGLGIPNLNIYITNKLDKQRKAKEAEEAQEALANAL